jgi:3-mercaptopyruvate sulfurtransferase SseA
MRLILSFFAIAILAVAVLTACNSAEWRNASTSPIAPKGTPQLAATPQPDGVRRVTVKELKQMLDDNEAVVIDVRNEASYNMGHIKGSKLIPEAEVAKRLDELPKNKLIVTYCS